MIVRTERDIKYRAMSATLRDAGYISIGKPLLQPYRLFGILMVACNTIGEMIGSHPIRVYQALAIRVERATKGLRHIASESKYVRASGHQDAETLHVFCPCCGADLLSAGPLDPAEIAREAKARAELPRKSPQSAEDERTKSPSIGNAEQVER